MRKDLKGLFGGSKRRSATAFPRTCRTYAIAFVPALKTKSEDHWLYPNQVGLADEGVIGPAVPQARDHVIELPGAPIALAVLDMLLKAKVERGIWIGSGDDIPAGAGCRKYDRARLSARDVIGRVERRRIRWRPNRCVR